MADDRIPDLRILLMELLRHGVKAWPELVQPSDVDRIARADDVMLVSARVAASIAKRAGMTDAELLRVVESAKTVLPSSAKVDDFDPDVQRNDVPEPNRLMWRIDECLSDVSRRGSVPSWFVDSFWPQFLMRVASGNKPTSRDCSIMMTVLEAAGGKRG